MRKATKISILLESDGVALEDVTTFAPNGKKQVGNKGVALTGRAGQSIAGEYGIAAVTGDGKALGSQWGIAFAGCGENGTQVQKPLTDAKSIAIGGANTVSVVNKYGRAESGDGGVSVALRYGAAVSGKNGVSIAGLSGVARTGDQGIAITHWRSKASAGYEGIIVLGFREREHHDKPIRYRIGIVGKMEDFDIQVVDGLEANQIYQLDGTHEIVKVHDTPKKRREKK